MLDLNHENILTNIFVVKMKGIRHLTWIKGTSHGLFRFNNAWLVVILTPSNPKRNGATGGVSVWSHAPYLESGLGLDTRCRLRIIWADHPSNGLTARHMG